MYLNVLFLSAISDTITGETPPDSADADWDLLFRLAQQQKLTVPVFSALGGAMPEPERRKWRAAALQDVALQARRTEAFLNVYRQLLDRGVQP